MVHGRSRHRPKQGGVKRDNGDFKDMLSARLRDVKMECSLWVTKFLHVQYSKNTALTVVLIVRHSACIL